MGRQCMPASSINAPLKRIHGLSDYRPNRPIRLNEGVSPMHLGTVIHSTHRLQWYRGILYCIKCGSYCQTRVQGLKLECPVKEPGQAPPMGRARGLRRLKAGKHPEGSRSVFPLPDGAPPPQNNPLVDELTEPLSDLPSVRSAKSSASALVAISI